MTSQGLRRGVTSGVPVALRCTPSVAATSGTELARPVAGELDGRRARRAVALSQTSRTLLDTDSAIEPPSGVLIAQRCTLPVDRSVRGTRDDWWVIVVTMRRSLSRACSEHTAASKTVEGPLVTKTLALGDVDPVGIVRVLNHQEQRRNIAVVAGLLDQMDRAGHDPHLLYNFQVALFRESYRAQLADADINRALRRLADGKGPDWMGKHDADTLTYVAPAWRPLCAIDSRDSSDWELERITACRVVRQLREVGDGLAWRIHRYDRRLIVALSDHDAPGPLVNKAGLPSEIGRVVHRFQDTGQFSLLHDLTTVLRHHDLTEVHANGYRELREVKTRLTKSTLAKASKQRRQAQAALAAASGDTPLGATGPRLIRSDRQLRTHIRDVSRVMSLAERQGYAVARVHDRVVGIVHFPAIAASGRDPQELLTAYHMRRDAVITRRLPNTINMLHARIGFTEPRNAFFAPYSIYPLPVTQRTALICDLVLLDIMMDAETLRCGFEDIGVAAYCLLRTGSGPDADVLVVGDGPVRMTVHARAVSQMMFEFAQTACFVRALAADLADPPTGDNFIMTFSNEQAAWR